MGIFGKKSKETKKKNIVTDKELTVEELDKVTAGVLVNNDMISNLHNRINLEPTESEFEEAELTEEELDEVTAGIPRISGEDDRSI